MIRMQHLGGIWPPQFTRFEDAGGKRLWSFIVRGLSGLERKEPPELCVRPASVFIETPHLDWHRDSPKPECSLHLTVPVDTGRSLKNQDFHLFGAGYGDREHARAATQRVVVLLLGCDLHVAET